MRGSLAGMGIDIAHRIACGSLPGPPSQEAQLTFPTHAMNQMPSYASWMIIDYSFLTIPNLVMALIARSIFSSKHNYPYMMLFALFTIVFTVIARANARIPEDIQHQFITLEQLEGLATIHDEKWLLQQIHADNQNTYSFSIQVISDTYLQVVDTMCTVGPLTILDNDKELLQVCTTSTITDRTAVLTPGLHKVTVQADLGESESASVLFKLGKAPQSLKPKNIKSAFVRAKPLLHAKPHFEKPIRQIPASNNGVYETARRKKPVKKPTTSSKGRKKRSGRQKH